jgi:lysophospholipase L1-like esterase
MGMGQRLMGMGQRRIEPSDDEASRKAALWGPDPVHPTAAAHRVMADAIDTDLQNPE